MAGFNSVLNMKARLGAHVRENKFLDFKSYVEHCRMEDMKTLGVFTPGITNKKLKIDFFLQRLIWSFAILDGLMPILTPKLTFTLKVSYLIIIL